jgi:ABC-type multidrug transport system permease subunit
LLAYDFPLLSLFWISLWWFFLLSVLFTIVWAFIDNFRRRDHGGWAKAAWTLLIIVLPLLGVLIYLIARPSDLAYA